MSLPHLFYPASARIAFQVKFSDSGAGIVSTTPTNSGGSATATFTRASVAWTRLSTGLWAQIATGTPRSYYLSDGTYAGFLSEFQATASATNVRDLSNAAWVKSASMTGVKDQTGIDGSANAASSLTSAGVDQTALQTLVLGAANYVFQPFVKRVTGTGEIDITIDNGTTWTNITSLINSSTWTQVQVTKNAANPVCGFRVRTSGDKIAVDMCDLTNNTIASSPLNATSRVQDVLTYLTSGNVNAAGGAVACQYSAGGNSGSRQTVWSFLDTGATSRLTFRATDAAVDNAAYVIGNGTSIDSILDATVNTKNAMIKAACRWGGANQSALWVSGTSRATVATASSTAPSATLGIGCSESGSSPLTGSVLNLVVYSTPPSDGQMAAITT